MISPCLQQQTARQRPCSICSHHHDRILSPKKQLQTIRTLNNHLPLQSFQRSHVSATSPMTKWMKSHKKSEPTMARPNVCGSVSHATPASVEGDQSGSCCVCVCMKKQQRAAASHLRRKLENRASVEKTLPSLNDRLAEAAMERVSPVSTNAGSSVTGSPRVMNFEMRRMSSDLLVTHVESGSNRRVVTRPILPTTHAASSLLMSSRIGTSL